MENASKALLIAGAILLCILIIAIGMYIYNSAESTVTDSMDNLSTQEIEAFNAQFTVYEGVQTGSELKALMGRLIANADTYAEEPAKQPYVYIERMNSNDWGITARGCSSDEGNTLGYIQNLAQIKNKVDTKHEYKVEFSYQQNGLIDYITISYNPDNPMQCGSNMKR